MKAPQLVDPDTWGRETPGAFDHRPLSVIVEANVHHSAEPRPSSHRGCPAQVRGFDHFHRTVRGWSSLAYSWVICPHGTAYEGRSLDVVPAAALGHNTPIAAYCLMAEDEKATDAQWATLLWLIAHDARRIGHALRLTTHREVVATTCPGNPIQRQVTAYRRRHGHLVAPAGVELDGGRQEGEAPAAGPRYPGRLVKRGSRGGAVTRVTERLAERGWSIAPGGRFTAAVEATVRAFQAEKGLDVDGVVGPDTWRALWNAPIT